MQFAVWPSIHCSSQKFFERFWEHDVPLPTGNSGKTDHFLKQSQTQRPATNCLLACVCIRDCLFRAPIREMVSNHRTFVQHAAWNFMVGITRSKVTFALFVFLFSFLSVFLLSLSSLSLPSCSLFPFACLSLPLATRPNANASLAKTLGAPSYSKWGLQMRPSLHLTSGEDIECPKLL